MNVDRDAGLSVWAVGALRSIRRQRVLAWGLGVVNAGILIWNLSLLADATVPWLSMVGALCSMVGVFSSGHWLGRLGGHESQVRMVDDIMGQFDGSLRSQGWVLDDRGIWQPPGGD